jgi:flagellar biosynthesis protein FlhB
VSESKPFEPSQSRLERARREGDVPRVGELTAVASLAGTSLASLAMLPHAAGAARVALVNAARGVPAPDAYAVMTLCVAGAILSGATFAVLAAALAGGGLHLRFVPPSLTKLDPLAGVKRMLSRDSIVSGASAAVAATVAGVSLIPVVCDAFVSMLAGSTPASLAALALHAVERCIAAGLAVGLAFGAGDAFFERLRWRRRLRMTFDEMKRDLKANEGDPLFRNRRRTQHRALLRGSISRIADAAFVVTNPTHIAVALEYRPPEVAVPRVLVRAIDAGAQIVKQRARELRIPLIENAPLARALFATTDVGGYIPRERYLDVAQIVAALLREGALG